MEYHPTILHIAHSPYRIRDISVGTLTSGPAASRAARHACIAYNAIALSISLSTASTA